MNTETPTGILTESEREELQRAIAESDVAGCSLVDQDIDSLVDLFEAWLERREREPSVEDCLRELREMVPAEMNLGIGRSGGDGYIAQHGRIVLRREFWSIHRRAIETIARGRTLSECMAQVRAWKESEK